MFGEWKCLSCLILLGIEVCFFFVINDSIMFSGFNQMEISLQGKADPNFYVAGLSPMQYAAKEGDTKFLEYLIKAKGDPNSSDKVNFYVSLGLLLPSLDLVASS